jgi:hypothetical protein
VVVVVVVVVRTRRKCSLKSVIERPASKLNEKDYPEHGRSCVYRNVLTCVTEFILTHYMFSVLSFRRRSLLFISVHIFVCSFSSSLSNCLFVHLTSHLSVFPTIKLCCTLKRIQAITSQYFKLHCYLCVTVIRTISALCLSALCSSYPHSLNIAQAFE